jgi:hypothetical protein
MAIAITPSLKASVRDVGARPRRRDFRATSVTEPATACARYARRGRFHKTAAFSRHTPPSLRDLLVPPAGRSAVATARRFQPA